MITRSRARASGVALACLWRVFGVPCKFEANLVLRAGTCRIAGAGKGFSDPVENLRELQRFCQMMCFSNLCVKQS
jgi:hypothetical protein